MGDAFSSCRGDGDDKKGEARYRQDGRPGQGYGQRGDGGGGGGGGAAARPNADGRWLSQKGQMQVIRGDTVEWENGGKSQLTMSADGQGRVAYAMVMQDQRYNAFMSADGKRLEWSDGDVWTRDTDGRGGVSPSRPGKRVCAVGQLFGVNCCEEEAEPAALGPSARKVPQADNRPKNDGGGFLGNNFFGGGGDPATQTADSVMKDGRVNFSGEWACTDIEGDFDAFLQEIGTGWVMRTAARTAGYGKGTASRKYEHRNGDCVTVEVSTPTGSYLQSFRIDAQRHRTNAQSGPCEVVASWESKTVLRCDFFSTDGVQLPSQRCYIQGADVLIIEGISPQGLQVKWKFTRKQ